MLNHIFGSRKVDHDVLYALQWKKPERVEVYLEKTQNGYFAKVVSLDGNVVTEAGTGQELFEMVNDAIYEYLDIPEQYRDKLGYFLPPDDIREELKVEIPAKYLNKVITATV